MPLSGHDYVPAVPGGLQGDGALMDLELEQHAEDVQACTDGDVWYDGAEHADWLTAAAAAYEEADGVDGRAPQEDLPLPQEVAAQAFQDARHMYEQLLAGTQSPEDLGQAMGVSASCTYAICDASRKAGNHDGTLLTAMLPHTCRLLHGMHRQHA